MESNSDPAKKSTDEDSTNHPVFTMGVSSNKDV
jgi:hypothetical protein